MCIINFEQVHIFWEFLYLNISNYYYIIILILLCACSYCSAIIMNKTFHKMYVILNYEINFNLYTIIYNFI